MILTFVTEREAAAPGKKLRVHSDGKVKTSLSVLNRAEQEYEFKYPARVLNNRRLFKDGLSVVQGEVVRQPLTNTFNCFTPVKQADGSWLHTQKLAIGRYTIKLRSHTENLTLDVLKDANSLLRHALFFKGIGYERLIADGPKTYDLNIRLEMKPTVDCSVDKVRVFKLPHIRVKKVFKDPILRNGKPVDHIYHIFFASETCKQINQWLKSLSFEIA